MKNFLKYFKKEKWAKKEEGDISIIFGSLPMGKGEKGKGFIWKVRFKISL